LAHRKRGVVSGESGALGAKKDASVRLDGDKMIETLRMLATQQSREGRVDVVSVVVQSGSAPATSFTSLIALVL
jgi:hypothetical protein